MIVDGVHFSWNGGSVHFTLTVIFFLFFFFLSTHPIQVKLSSLLNVSVLVVWSAAFCFFSSLSLQDV